MKESDWVKIQDWMNENKRLLIIVADPMTDSISVSYNLLNGFVRFPPGEPQNGVIFNALRASKFNDAIDPMIHGIMEATGIKDEDKNGQEVLKVIGGAVKAFGEELKKTRDEQLDEFFKEPAEGKIKKSRKK